MRRTFIGALALAVVVTWMAAPAPANAQAAQSQEKPQEPKAPPTPAGKWDMSVQTDQGPIPSTLDLKVEDKKVTGTIASDRGTTEIEGEFADGKLVFWLTMQGNGGSMTINFSGALKDDGSMAGTAEVQGYQMSWTATRAKSF